jgi:MFS family permease
MHFSKSELDIDEKSDNVQSPLSDLENSEQLDHVEDLEQGNENRDIEAQLRIEKTQSENELPIPDGGLLAWTQVFCAHLVVFNTWGSLQTFGTWQSYYTTHLPEPASTISWIGSVQLCLTFSLGPLAGRALDAGYYHHTYLAGLALATIGIMCASVSTEFWQVFLAQGVAQGIGNGLQFAPTLSLVGTYFKRNRAAAFAVISSGSSTGGLVYPLIVRTMIPKYGFGWTMRTIGFVTLVLGLLSGTFLRQRTKPRKSGPLLELRAFKEPAYTLYCAGMFLAFWGIFFPFYYLPSFAVSVSHFSSGTATLVLLVANVIGIVSRVCVSSLADRKFGPTTLMICCITLLALVDLLWMTLNHLHHPTAGVWVFAVVFGLVAASVTGMFPAALSGLTKDLNKQGARMGMAFGVAGISGLTGPVIGGALVQRAGGSYVGAQVWAGTSLLLAALLLTASRWVRVGWSFKTRL